MLSLVPGPWSNDIAKSSPGMLFSAASIYAVMLAKLGKQTTYVNQQKRILNAQADNLDAIANDVFGPGNFPRRLTVNGTALVAETDPIFSVRLAAAIIAPNNTILAVQNAVQSYLTAGYAAAVALNAQVLGLDTAGGLDTWGALDGRPNTLPPIPVCSVFDIQSNPTLSASVGLIAGDFCVLFTYGGLNAQGMFLNYAKLNFAYLVPDKLQIIPPLNSALAGIVQATKAQGMRPIYADNRG